MTEHMLTRYMAGGTFYHLQAAAAIDNPDQRLAADVDELAATAVSLAFTALRAAVEVPAFIAVLYRIHAPLCAAVLAYSAAGTALAYFLGRVRIVCDCASCRA